MKFESEKGNVAVWVAVLILAVLIIAGAWYWFQFKSPTDSEVKPLSGDDTTTAIQKDLDSVDYGANLESDLNEKLDADINSL